jgi:protein SCO1/2
MPWIRVFHSILILAACSAACSRGREYELRGQVLAVSPERQEIIVKHEDIRGFMPGMTMPFKVRDPRWLDGRAPGELVRATLVVESSDAYLKDIERTGEAPLAAGPPSPVPFDLLEPGQVVPELAFVDQSGRSHRLSDFRGRTVAVTFIYTRCPLPDFCPQMDRNFAAVQRTLAEAGPTAGRVHLLSISFDPEFDTPAVLAEHARRAGATPDTWSFVTGDRDDVDRFARGFGVSVMREDKSAQEILHNLRTAVIDPAGRLVKIFSGNDWQASALLAELRATIERG